MDELYKGLGMILGSALLAIALYTLKVINKKIKYHAETIGDHDVLIYKSIYEQLSVLLSTGADRVYIFEFHNGTEFSSSVMQWKISCTYELVRNGISRMQDRLKNLPATQFADWVSVFYSKVDRDLPVGIERASACKLCQTCKRECAFKCDTDTMEISMLSSELKLQGIHGMFQTGIRNKDGKLIGILGVDYCSEVHWDAIKDSESDIPHQLKETSGQIAKIWEQYKR